MEVNIGKGLTVEVPNLYTMAGDPDEKLIPVCEYIWRMGWHNVLMDSHANVTRASVLSDDEQVHANTTGEFPEEAEITRRVREQSLAIAEKKLAALVAGELRVSAERESKRDPVEIECENIARKMLAKALKAAGVKMKNVDKEIFAQAVKAQIEADPDIVKSAKRIVAERAKNAQVIDLTALGLVK